VFYGGAMGSSDGHRKSPEVASPEMTQLCQPRKENIIEIHSKRKTKDNSQTIEKKDYLLAIPSKLCKNWNDIVDVTPFL
jgi:hypothetical protein